MDGVPVFNLVRETLPAVTVVGFRGVVNSTTNHILTALEDGEGFAPALARMQAVGIAEADPSLDVDGWDAAAKASALANVLMERADHAARREARRASARQRPNARDRRESARAADLKLVASAARGRGRRRAPSNCRPTTCSPACAAWRTRSCCTTDLLGEIAICQLGGGLTQTAYALLSDLVTVRRRLGRNCIRA